MPTWRRSVAGREVAVERDAPPTVRHGKVTTDLRGEQIGDLCVPRDSLDGAGPRVLPQ